MKKLLLIFLTLLTASPAFGGIWLSRQIKEWTEPKYEYDPNKPSPFDHVPDDVTSLIINEIFETGDLETIFNIALLNKKFASLIRKFSTDLTVGDKETIKKYLYYISNIKEDYDDMEGKILTPTERAKKFDWLLLCFLCNTDIGFGASYLIINLAINNLVQNGATLDTPLDTTFCFSINSVKALIACGLDINARSLYLTNNGRISGKKTASSSKEITLDISERMNNHEKIQALEAAIKRLRENNNNA